MNDAHKWLQKAPGLLTFSLVIALGVTLANLLWLVLTPAVATAEAAVLSSTLKTTRKPQQNYGKLIADQHLFGAIPKAAPKAAPVRAATPKAMPKPVVKNLKFKLHGIVASSQAGNGFAMISYNGKTQETYIRGEALPKKEADKARALSGVTLKHVDKEFVLVDNNGHEQRLELEALGQVNSNNKASKTTRTTQPTKARQARSDTRTTANAVKNNRSGGIQTLAELRDALLKDPQAITTVITPSLVRKDGVVTGLRVYPSKNRALFRELGFRNGDIITQVNGTIIDGSPSNLAVLQQFADSSSLEITVLRGGNETTLNPSF